MGTPEFAVPALKRLFQDGFNIAAVITAPDKPAGRGLVSTQSAVKKFALENKLPILQPANLKSPEFISTLQQLKADLQVVVAFRMLPEVVWNMPPLGTINLHASLLPDYRGAAPINHAIINGETETGLTTFFLQKEIDTGDMIYTEKINIDKTDNAGTLHNKMMETGAQLLLKTVKAIESGAYPRIRQNASSIKTAPKIHKENCEIQWNKPAQTIHNFIRGLSPYLGAWTTMEGKTVKIFTSGIIPENEKITPGKIITDKKTYLRFAAMDGLIDVVELQLEGKRKMHITEFLKGYRFE